MPQPGDRFGDFVLVRELGRGAMGVVWAARQESLGREVALKVLGEAYAADPTWVARFQAEAGAAARLSHPGILPVYAVGETNGLPWFAMEKVDGQNLSERVEAHGRPSWEEIARTVKEAAYALHHAHEHGLVHRDIKPANLMRRSDGRIVLTDFGLSKRMGSGSLTTTGLLVGTPYYMSPELVAGQSKQVGPATDVYGLGVTLYELTTGRPPFEAENAVALIRKITDADPEPPSRREPRVPRDLETIALVCLAKRPERRYPSAKALAEDLERFLAHEPITVRRAGAGERLARFVRKNRVAVGVVGALLVVLVGVLLLFTREIEDREASYRAQIARLLAEADAHAEAGDTEKAEAVEQQVKDLAAQDPDAARAAAQEISADFLRDLKEGREPSRAYRETLASWATQAPAKVTLETVPAGATVVGMRFVGQEGREMAPVVLDGRDLVPGLWRLHLTAPGRLRTVVTLLASPATKGRIEVTLPPENAAGRREVVAYGGAWFPAAEDAVDGYVRELAPYLLDAQRVTVAEYRAFVFATTTNEEQRLAMRPPERRGRGLRDDDPVLGLTEAQASAYAKWKGARLPTNGELRNAIGPGFMRNVLTEAAPIKRLEGEERRVRFVQLITRTAAALRQFEGLEGWDLRSEWMTIAYGPKAGTAGRYPDQDTLREIQAGEGVAPGAAKEGAAETLERNTALRLARSWEAP